MIRFPQSKFQLILSTALLTGVYTLPVQAQNEIDISEPQPDIADQIEDPETGGDVSFQPGQLEQNPGDRWLGRTAKNPGGETAAVKQARKDAEAFFENVYRESKSDLLRAYAPNAKIVRNELSADGQMKSITIQSIDVRDYLTKWLAAEQRMDRKNIEFSLPGIAAEEDAVRLTMTRLEKEPKKVFHISLVLSKLNGEWRITEDTWSQIDGE